MNFLRMESKDGKPIVVLEEIKHKFFGLRKTKKERKFLCTRRIVGQFYSWVELPGMELVPDRLSFRLDEIKDLND